MSGVLERFEVLTQVQIIQSLGEALTWFQRELSWGVAPAELRHLTGRIGELYAAMITNGQMAPETNQHGYDVVSADNERISVKTFTSSTHVSFRESTFRNVDRVMILKIEVDGTDASIRCVFDGLPQACLERCRRENGNLRFSFSTEVRSKRPIENLQVVDQAEYGPHLIVRYENGTIIVRTNDVREASAINALKKIASEIGVRLTNSSDNPRNTRQLGGQVIDALKRRLALEQTTPSGERYIDEGRSED